MNLNDLFTEEKVRLDPKCWTGKKIGNPKTKMKGGVRVNNCVPAESVNEMDKSQTPPGRDGSNDEGGKKEYTAKASTPEKVAKDGEKILNKELNKKQGMAEAVAPSQYAKLYHSTPAIHLDGILQSGYLAPTGKGYLSLTRDSKLDYGSWGGEFVEFDIDQNAVRQRIKLEPYVDPTTQTGARAAGRGESEERTTQKIPLKGFVTAMHAPTGWEGDKAGEYYGGLLKKYGVPIIYDIVPKLEEQGMAEGSEYKSRHAHKQEQDKAYNDYRTKHATSSLALMTRAEFAKDQRERAAKKKQGVAEGYTDDDIETTRQFRNAIAGLKARSAVDKAKDGVGAKYYADGAKVTPQETARRAAERKAQKDKKGVAEGDLDEGWKEKLGGAALAGAMALGAGGANARVMPGDDPSINRLTGKPIATQQATDTAPARTDSTSGFSKEYLQKAANPDRFGRYLISIEKAQELLKQMNEGDKKSAQPEADYGDDYQDMVARVKKLAGMGPLKTVYDPAKRVYRNVPTAQQPKK